MFPSAILHLSLPGGDWMLAFPRNTPLSETPRTLRSMALCSRVKMQPCLLTLPTPMNVVPLQQKRYWPVTEFHSSTMVGSLSSCRHTSKTVTVKLHVAVLPDASVAVQVTVVAPTGKHEPDGGVQTTTTPGQLSLAVGGGNMTIKHAGAPDAHTFWGVTAVTLAGHVITGGWVSLTVTVNVQLAELPTASMTVQVTVVVPTGKNDPEAGEQAGVPTPGQLSLTVGGG
jgi:hypothetical protein